MDSSSSDQWVYVVAPLFAYGLASLGLAAWGWGEGAGRGNPVTGFFRAISWSLHRLTGLSGWSMAGALTGLTAAGIAAVGLYWDVAWHVDLGRDDELFTPSHTMILIGLNGLVFAAAIAVLFANLDRGWQGWRGLRVPWSAVVLGALGLGASAAFPLDDLWHRAYGVDVTLWSPTHLQLIAGGSLSPMAVWLMVREGRRDLGPSGPAERESLGPSGPAERESLGPSGPAERESLGPSGPAERESLGPSGPAERESLGPSGAAERDRPGSGPTGLGRAIEVLCFGAILTGLSIPQGEFDFGVPQFQVLYQPILLSAAAGLALVAARTVLGRGGALLATAGFLALRGIFALLVGGALNHTVPRFPLYLVAAVAVEVVAWVLGTERRVRFAVVCGAAVATIGLGAELAWIQLSGWGSPSTSDRPIALLLSLAAGIAAAVLGVALVGGAVPSRRRNFGPLVVGAAGLALIVVLAIPLPRDLGVVEAVISLDRLDGEATVSVQLDPPEAAEGASAFGLIAWQGGGRVLSDLVPVGPGRYVSAKPIPVSGRWKSMVGLQRGNEVMAAPIYLPADPEIGASAVPAQAERRVAFARNTDILLREAKDGPAWPALLSYAGVAVVLALWLALFTRAASPIRPATRPRSGGRRGLEAAPALRNDP